MFYLKHKAVGAFPTTINRIRETLDNTTTGVAAAMVTSPWWLAWLQSASEIAALIAPILGVGWLCVQIWAKIKETKEKLEDE